MSRSGYSEDVDNDWHLIMWRGAVNSAIKGGRGQAFLKEMLSALDALPEPKLVKNELEHEGTVCAMGAVGKARGVDMTKIDPFDSETVANIFGIANALVKEIAFENDEGLGYWREDETPEHRFSRMRKWIESQILEDDGP